MGRPRQDTPTDLVNDLLGVIRNQFYTEDRNQWFKDQAFLRRNVVLWPADWLNQRGVTLPLDRYKKILLGVFNTIKIHGDTDAVHYWPGYLMHCVQEHFRHHEEEIYEEAKSVRVKLDQALGKLTPEQRVTADSMRILSEAYKLSASPRKRRGKRPAATQQALF